MQDKRKIGNGAKVIIAVLAVLILSIGSIWAGSQSFDGNGRKETPTVESMARGAGSDNGAGIFMSMANDAVVSKEYAETESASPVPAPAERKIVRSASLTLATPNYDSGLSSLRALVESAGGYVSDFYEYGDISNGEKRTATISLRVPSNGLDAFLAGAQGVARITSRSESSTDMTVQYSDNEARLGTLRTKLARLNELMQNAETTSDLIELESAISDTQYEIDMYETRQRTIDRDVDMSAVSVTLCEETPAESAAAEDTSLGARLKAAVKASLKGIGEFFKNMLVFIVMALPVIVPLIVVIVIIVAVRRRRAEKRGEQADKGEDEKAEA